MGQPARATVDRVRRHLQLALAFVWLLDAALQFQPYMFSRSFSTDTLAPTAQGNPGWVAAPISWVTALVSHHPAPWNLAFAITQLVLALGLFRPRTVKATLIASIPWSLGVWWLGEGLGGNLTGAASPLTGAPGAVVIYALLAVLLWPRPSPSGCRSVADASPLGRAGSRVLWLVLWGGLAYEMLLPANRSATGTLASISAMAKGEPSWLAAIDRRTVAALGPHSADTAAVVAGLLAATALAVFDPPTLKRAWLLLAMVFAATVWVVGEDLGGLLTGTATDPNSGPLLVLLAAAYWPVRLSRRENALHGLPARPALPVLPAGAIR